MNACCSPASTPARSSAAASSERTARAQAPPRATSAASSGKKRSICIDRMQLEALTRLRRLEQQLVEFDLHALAGQAREVETRAERAQLGVGLEREARRELHHAQPAQRIARERARVGRAQHARGEIGAAAQRVEDLLRERVEPDRVDREVAPARRGGEVGDRSQRKVGLEPREPHHRERAPERVHGAEPAQDSLELGRGEPVDLHVEVLLGRAEQPVAHEAAHHESATAARADRLGDGSERLDHAASVGRISSRAAARAARRAASAGRSPSRACSERACGSPPCRPLRGRRARPRARSRAPPRGSARSP